MSTSNRLLGFEAQLRESALLENGRHFHGETLQDLYEVRIHMRLDEQSYRRLRAVLDGMVDRDDTKAFMP